MLLKEAKEILTNAGYKIMKEGKEITVDSFSVFNEDKELITKIDVLETEEFPDEIRDVKYDRNRQKIIFKYTPELFPNRLKKVLTPDELYIWKYTGSTTEEF